MSDKNPQPQFMWAVLEQHLFEFRIVGLFFNEDDAKQSEKLYCSITHDCVGPNRVWTEKIETHRIIAP